MDLNKIQSEINSITTAAELDNLRIKYLGRNGQINQEFQNIKNSPNPRQLGQDLNQLKKEIENYKEIVKLKLTVKKGPDILPVSVDTSKPDFELLVLKFDKAAPDPKFKKFLLDKYDNGLIIIRSPQCPYSVKNVDAIIETAKKLKIEADLIDLKDHESARQTPCAFGTFCIIHNNEVISHHPISNGRFKNIMAKR